VIDPAERLGSKRGWTSILPVVAVFFSSSDALARQSHPWSTPVEVMMLGPDPVKVRVASGVTMPCDSIDNRPLIVGRFNPGEAIRAVAVGNGCICFQQTYAPLSDSDWSIGTLICTACKYNPYTRAWACPPSNTDPTIRIKVASSRPK
jgi:hypothetical protein